eukprot:1157423-Pelagomonas_calceolata.AAC.5
MVFFWSKDSRPLIITHFDAVGGLEWRFGGQKVELMLPIGHVFCNWQSSHPNRAPKLESCPFWRTYAESKQKTGNFRPQITLFDLMPSILNEAHMCSHGGSTLCHRTPLLKFGRFPTDCTCPCAQ